MMCICDKPLTEYVLVYVIDPSEYVNHDWVREHGVIVDFAAREHPLLKWHSYKESRTIYALTIAEAYRLVESEEGGNRAPLHRVLNEDREEIYKCQVKGATIASLNESAIERFMAQYDNAGSR